MSLVSTRSAGIAVGIAVCALAAFARPARSWVLHRYVENVTDVCPDNGSLGTRGYYPNPDVIVLSDYDGARGKLNGQTIRIEMDIPVKDAGYLAGIQTALHDGATTDNARRDLYDKIAKAGNINRSASAGLRVLKAAVGCLQPSSSAQRR